MKAKREIELKLQVDAAAIAKLTAMPIFDGSACEEHFQSSTYFDTADFAVRDAGLSLRVRTVDGRHQQTVKAESAQGAGLFSRPEWEILLVDDKPVFNGIDNPLAALLSPIQADRLKPIFQIKVVRRSRDILQDGATIQLVADIGDIKAKHRKLAVNEVELELKDGSPAAVFAIARKMDAVAPVELSFLSKAQLGYRLFAGSADVAVKAASLTLDGQLAPAEGFEIIAHACIKQFRQNQTISARSKTSEALHQTRVSLRRLRSAFFIFKSIIADDASARLLAELQWVGGELDRARDLDVLLAGSKTKSAEPILLKTRRRAFKYAAVALASSRVRIFMLDLVEWITIGAWRTLQADRTSGQSLDEFASKALDRGRRRVRRGGRHWKDLGNKERHRLRIETKKLRYASDFFRSIFPELDATKRQPRFFKALNSLQMDLGDLNDRAVAKVLLAELGIKVGIHTSLPGRGVKRQKALLRHAAKSYHVLIRTKSFWG